MSENGVPPGTEEIRVSKRALNDSLNSSTSNSPEAKKVKSEKLSAVLFFKIEQNYIKNKKELSKLFKENHIGINELVITQNDNSIVHPATIEDKEKLLLSELFNNTRKIDLGIEKKHILIVKGVSGEELLGDIGLEGGKVKGNEYEITDIIPIKNKEQKELNICKIEVSR